MAQYRGLGVGLLCGFLLAGAPTTQAEVLSGEDIRLHGRSIAPAASAPLNNASETIHLQASGLGMLGAGHSSGSSGIQLHVGVAPVPEPSALWQLGAGVLGLGALLRRRGRSRG